MTRKKLAALARWLLPTIALTSATVLVVRRQARRADRHPPTGTFLDVDGVRLHFLERGQWETRRPASR